MGGRTGKNKQRESNEMYHWLNYCPLYTPRQLNFIIFSFFFPLCSLWSNFWNATMTFWPLTTWRTCSTAKQRSSPPSPPGPKLLNTPNGLMHKLSPRPPGSVCWRAPWPTKSEQNRTGHGGGGIGDALAWNWIGSGLWVDWAVSGDRGGN